MKSAPAYLLDGKLLIKWTSAEEAEAVIHEGEVVVFMKRSSHQHENIARALMAYIPRAVIPRARRFVDPATMKAADLVLAKSVLCQEGVDCAALETFYAEFMDRAREMPELKSKIERLDEIDVHGWLGRVLLAEYYMLARRMYPSEPRPAWLRETELFADWLHGLATRAPGERGSLVYQGRLISVGIIFVAIKTRLEEHGIEPYRRRAKRLIYQEKIGAVYLMARDNNIPAVRQLAEVLQRDALVETCSVYEYNLRSDFAAKKTLAREKAIAACLRRRLKPAESDPPLDEEDPADLPHETFAFSTVEAELTDSIPQHDKS